MGTVMLWATREGPRPPATSDLTVLLAVVSYELRVAGCVSGDIALARYEGEGVDQEPR